VSGQFSPLHASFPLRDLSLRSIVFLPLPLTAPLHPIFGSLRSVLRSAHAPLTCSIHAFDRHTARLFAVGFLVVSFTFQWHGDDYNYCNYYNDLSSLITSHGMHISYVRFLVYSKSSADQSDSDLPVYCSALCSRYGWSLCNVCGKQAAASVTRCHVNTPAVRRRSAVCATVNKDFDSTRATTGRVKASARNETAISAISRPDFVYASTRTLYTLRIRYDTMCTRLTCT